MTLTRRGDEDYGDRQADIREELVRYGKANTYEVHHFADAVCNCGGTLFQLTVDDGVGAAVRSCSRCKAAHPMGDSAEYLDEAELDECECPCGSGDLEVTAGVSLYADSEDVRWIYLGCRCPRCGLVAIYADWKNEFTGYRELLARI